MNNRRRGIPLALRKKQKNTQENVYVSRHMIKGAKQNESIKKVTKKELKKKQAEDNAEMGGIIRNEDLLDELDEIDFKQKLEYIKSISKEKDFVYFTREQVYNKYDDLIAEDRYKYEKDENDEIDIMEQDNYDTEVESQEDWSEEEYELENTDKTKKDMD